MRKVEIICDSCGKDLSESDNSIDWRIALTNERIPSCGGFVTDMYICPGLKKNCHFCGLGCMRKWFDETYPVEKE
ncbi:MAG: hypothetical protein K940chlam3_00118 [Chlamydiae bacterium]|nr:hypothetical protein [Chlamydiota bacterium]